MPVNARDTQIIRESVIAGNAHARDVQIVREAIILVTSHARDYQVFREAIIPAPASSSRLPVLFAAQ